MASHALTNACTRGHTAVGSERGDLGVSQLAGAAEKHDGTCFGVHRVLALDAPIIGCFYRCPESGPLILVSTLAHVCVARARAFPRAHGHAHAHMPALKSAMGRRQFFGSSRLTGPDVQRSRPTPTFDTVPKRADT